ncbi:MAG TPA: SCO family protein [Chloroflexota bacterium]|nr:SCO family protein [Chloroflexota bacterium]HUM71738.1 SCO family protein [Chloroflexota bacterium]
MSSTKWAAIIFFFFLIGCQTPHKFAGTLLPEPQPAPDIILESADGPVSLHDFAGQYTFVYFGYRFCPDVCPITMGKLKQVKADLGDRGDEMAVVMITVDPERDTPDALAEYMDYFDSSFVGLSGDQEAIDAIGKPFGLYYHQHQGTETSGYMVDHTASFFLLDRDANIIMAYAHETPMDALLRDVEYLIKNQ